MDKDGDGQISYEEFEHWWRVKEVEGLPVEAVCEGLAEAGVVCFSGGVPEPTLRAALRAEREAHVPPPVGMLLLELDEDGIMTTTNHCRNYSVLSVLADSYEIVGCFRLRISEQAAGRDLGGGARSGDEISSRRPDPGCSLCSNGPGRGRRGLALRIQVETKATLPTTDCCTTLAACTLRAGSEGARGSVVGWRAGRRLRTGGHGHCG